MGGTLLQGAPLDATPGRLYLNIQTEEQSPVFEACLFFQKQGDCPAVINFVTAEVADLAGAQQPAAVVMLANPNTQKPDVAGSHEEATAENMVQHTPRQEEH